MHASKMSRLTSPLNYAIVSTKIAIYNVLINLNCVTCYDMRHLHPLQTSTLSQCQYSEDFLEEEDPSEILLSHGNNLYLAYIMQKRSMIEH